MAIQLATTAQVWMQIFSFIWKLNTFNASSFEQICTRAKRNAALMLSSGNRILERKYSTKFGESLTITNDNAGMDFNSLPKAKTNGYDFFKLFNSNIWVVNFSTISATRFSDRSCTVITSKASIAVLINNSLSQDNKSVIMLHK